MELAQIVEPRQALKRLNARHHLVAKFLAKGVPAVTVAVMVGMRAGTISLLKGDKSFRELIDFYTDHEDVKSDEFFERLGGIAKDAAAELEFRLEVEPDKIPVTQLLKIIEVTADRTGHGPQTTTNHNVTHDIADRLQAARRRMIVLDKRDVVPEMSEAEIILPTEMDRTDG